MSQVTNNTSYQFHLFQHYWEAMSAAEDSKTY